MNSQRKIGIFWDVDGTLSDSFRLGFSSTNVILKNNGKAQISATDYKYGTQYSTRERLALHATGNLKDQIGLTLERQFNDYYIKLVSIKTAPLYKGIKDVLVFFSLKYPELKMGVLSNASSDYVNAVLVANNINHYFHIALGADKVSQPKPSPDGLLACCKALELLPNKCIYIGDGPTDGEAATSAGMKSIGVTWGNHACEKIVPFFTHIAHSVDDLIITTDNLLFSN